MSSPADIRVDVSRLDPHDLAEAVDTSCSDVAEWSRDGILEHQVSTHEDVQLCYRNEPAGSRPRTGLCLAGTDDTLTVAAVVPIDRGIELADDQYRSVVRDFHDEILVPALDDRPATAEFIPENG